MGFSGRTHEGALAFQVEAWLEVVVGGGFPDRPDYAGWCRANEAVAASCSYLPGTGTTAVARV